MIRCVDGWAQVMPAWVSKDGGASWDLAPGDLPGRSPLSGLNRQGLRSATGTRRLPAAHGGRGKMLTTGVRNVARPMVSVLVRVLGFEPQVSLGACISDTEKGPPQPPPRGGEGWRRPKVALLSPGIVVEGEVSTPDILGFWSAPHGAAAKPVRLTAWGNHPFASRRPDVTRSPRGVLSYPFPRLTAQRTHLFPSRGTPRPVLPATHGVRPPRFAPHGSSGSAFRNSCSPHLP